MQTTLPFLPDDTTATSLYKEMYEDLITQSRLIRPHPLMIKSLFEKFCNLGDTLDTLSPVPVKSSPPLLLQNLINLYGGDIDPFLPRIAQHGVRVFGADKKQTGEALLNYAVASFDDEDNLPCSIAVMKTGIELQDGKLTETALQAIILKNEQYEGREKGLDEYKNFKSTCINTPEKSIAVGEKILSSIDMAIAQTPSCQPQKSYSRRALSALAFGTKDNQKTAKTVLARIVSNTSSCDTEISEQLQFLDKALKKNLLSVHETKTGLTEKMQRIFNATHQAKKPTEQDKSLITTALYTAVIDPTALQRHDKIYAHLLQNTARYKADIATFLQNPEHGVRITSAYLAKDPTKAKNIKKYGAFVFSTAVTGYPENSRTTEYSRIAVQLNNRSNTELHHTMVSFLQNAISMGGPAGEKAVEQAKLLNDTLTPRVVMDMISSFPETPDANTLALNNLCLKYGLKPLAINKYIL